MITDCVTFTTRSSLFPRRGPVSAFRLDPRLIALQTPGLSLANPGPLVEFAKIDAQSHLSYVTVDAVDNLNEARFVGERRDEWIQLEQIRVLQPGVVGALQPSVPKS